jgi:hypothetical protein
MVVSGGQIHHTLCLLFFAVSHQWQAAAQARQESTCILRNKVSHRSLKPGRWGQIWLGAAVLRVAAALS